MGSMGLPRVLRSLWRMAGGPRKAGSPCVMHFKPLTPGLSCSLNATLRRCASQLSFGLRHAGHRHMRPGPRQGHGIRLAQVRGMAAALAAGRGLGLLLT
jgi:hypothetical protein